VRPVEYFVVRPRGFVVENAHIHGITHEDACRDGIPFRRVTKRLLRRLSEVDELVAHNVVFDANILLSELYRRGYSDAVTKLSTMHMVCTMRLSKDVLRLHKWPRLAELCDAARVEFEGTAHNARDDARACARCYLWLRATLRCGEIRRIGIPNVRSDGDLIHDSAPDGSGPAGT
jgi:DNA polymerase III epsilon subunit-like protein